MIGMIMPIRACKLMTPYISFTHIISNQLAAQLNNLFNVHKSSPPLHTLSPYLLLSVKDAHTSFSTQGKAGKAWHRACALRGTTPDDTKIKTEGACG